MQTSPDAAERTTYGPVSRINHWVVAFGMLAALGAGLAIAYLPLDPETRRSLLDWHRSIGVAVLAAGVWRLGRRLVRGFPEPAAPTSPRQEAAARALHWTLIATTILMPVSGILMTVLDGRAVGLAGSLTIPAVAENPLARRGRREPARARRHRPRRPDRPARRSRPQASSRRWRHDPREDDDRPARAG